MRISDWSSDLCSSDLLGYPFYDIATLPLLQGEGFDEFDPIKIDRISPSDATAIRVGGAAAMLKGIEFNSFGALFSRAYRENDYLWGRLHGADRLIDIVARSEEHTSEIQSLMRISYAVFCLNKKKDTITVETHMLNKKRHNQQPENTK